MSERWEGELLGHILKANHENLKNLYFDLFSELSPMAAPDFESNRPNSDLHVEISRILERLIKESKCVDLEALCIISGKVEERLLMKVNISHT